MQAAEDEGEDWGREVFHVLETHFVVIDAKDQIVGAGTCLDAAIQDAEDYNEKRDPGERRCPHCHRYPDDKHPDGWRAYLVTADAYDLLTCGGPFEDALTNDPDFSWCDGVGAIVYVRQAWCVACRGKGRLPRKHMKPGSPPVACPHCEDGYIEREGIEYDVPPDDEAVWRTGDPHG